MGRGRCPLTCCQLALLHGRQAEHIGAVPGIGFIKGFDVDGELLHKRAGEPKGRGAPVRTAAWLAEAPGWE